LDLFQVLGVWMKTFTLEYYAHHYLIRTPSKFLVRLI